jgi:hypothetical protein
LAGYFFGYFLYKHVAFHFLNMRLLFCRRPSQQSLRSSAKRFLAGFLHADRNAEVKMRGYIQD